MGTLGATRHQMLYRSLLAVWVTLLLSACVTTEKGVFTTKASDDKALDYSVQAARSYIRDENWESARRHLKNALELDGKNAEVHEALALVFQNTGELELADSHYKRAVGYASKESRVSYNYGVFLYGQKRYKEAVRQFEEVTKDTLYERRSAAFYNLGRSYTKVDSHVKAEQALRRSYLINKRSPSVMLALADALYVIENYPESQRFYKKYRNYVKKQSAKGLWLGIRLADQYGDRDALASYVLALKNLYPRSKEYLDYRNSYANGK